MKKYIYIIGFLSLLLTACSSSDDFLGGSSDNENITLSFQVNSFVKGNLRAAADNGSDAEQRIENLYVFLFPTSDTQSFKSYYISEANFTGGSWNSTDNKVSLNLTQAEAGNRDVYIVANCSSELKTSLDGISTIEELQTALQSNETPWSPILTTPILMSGNKTHNFNTNYQLNNVLLIRAVAKVQLNITLSEKHQTTLISSEDNTRIQYKYKFIGFDKNTYILKQASKEDNPVSFSAWADWQENGTVASYTKDETGNVTALQLITYLNERTKAGASIEISIPYIDGGILPPPEFGDEVYKLQLPAKIERNNWYTYEVKI